MIRVVYIGVGIKILLGEYDYLPKEDIITWVKKAIAEHGYNPDTDYGRLYISHGGEQQEYNPGLMSLEDDITLIYVNVPSPQNAYVFCEEDGIKYIFHTAEAPHREYPHCHAKFGDSEISISLTDFSVIGKCHDYKKRRAALNYVKKHKEELLAEWNRMMETQ